MLLPIVIPFRKFNFVYIWPRFWLRWVAVGPSHWDVGLLRWYLGLCQNIAGLLWWYLDPLHWYFGLWLCEVGSLQWYLSLPRCPSYRYFLGLIALVMGLELLKVVVCIHGPITLRNRLITLSVGGLVFFLC